jgi:predicted dehydrogenase
MLLPEGVFYRPRQEFLIAQDKWATIWMRTDGKYSVNDEYTIRDRTFERDIAPFLHGDWADFHQRLKLQPREIIKEQQEKYATAVYSGAEHRGNPKLPNITVIPNLTTKLTTKDSQGLMSRWEVFGCSMGHYHPPGHDPRVQEVYEFQSYGLMVLDYGTANVEMWVAKDGDKVTVPNGCHMTLYNLGDRDNPLITLDYANPDLNPANKNLVSKCGPILLAYYNDLEVSFALNRHYINNEEYSVGVRLSESRTRQRFIKIVRGARLELGKLLYEELSHNYKLIGKFAQLGISVRQASPQAVLEPLETGRGSHLYFCSPLVKATKEGTEVDRYFFKDRFKQRRTSTKLSPGRHSAPPRKDKPADNTPDVGENQPPTPRPKRSRTLNRPLVIVVEGGGDWVDKAYRKLFIQKVTQEHQRLSVFYADDTRWKNRPAWANPLGLQEWETYLDKADINDYGKYRNLRPDVVFVVTPDFTHSDIASSWVGKTPVVFVEKPFDSQVKNVDDLLMENPQEQGTVIYGLDHYQFYALPIHDPDVDIDTHLGKILARVAFYLAEKQALEKDRVRSLQYGLTLDLLPHLTALLTYFGDVSSIDEIRVIEAGRYFVDPSDQTQKGLPLEFHNETYSRIEFTLLDRSGSGERIPCTAVVGKGFPENLKFLEVVGQNGNAIRIDLNEGPKKKEVPKQDGEDMADAEGGYPWNSLFFLLGENVSPPDGAVVRSVRCPYNSQRTLRILSSVTNPSRFRRPVERERYGKLIDDLLTSEKQTVKSLLSLTDGRHIVFALDRIWWAVQAARPWIEYSLQGENPIKGTIGSALTSKLYSDSLDKNLIRPIRSYGADPRYGRSRIKAIKEPLPTRRGISKRRAKRSPHTRQTDPLTLVELLEKLRKEVNGLPLTILIHNWGSKAAGEFLDALHPKLEDLDAVWLISIDKTKANTPLPEIENVVMLNLSEDTDKHIYNNLVGDVVFYPALNRAEAAHDKQFMRLARAIIIDWGAPAVDTVLQAAHGVGALTYLWSGKISLKEPEAGSASSVAGSEEELGSLAVDEIGRRLKESATDLKEMFYRRRLFKAELDRIFHLSSSETDWSADLVRQADLHGWPSWAVECLPLFVALELSDAETKRAFVWRYIMECVPETYAFETVSELCEQMFSELTMPEETARFVDSIVQEFTSCFKANPVINDRDFLGTIVHAMTQIESIYPDAASKIRDARTKVLTELKAI